jgi:hypothetical protein
MRTILAKLAAEFRDEKREIVPVIKRERKKERPAASLPEEIQFPAVRPEIKLSKTLEVPQIQVDTEAMIRAYIAGQRTRSRRKEEEEWLLMYAN